MPCVWNMYEEPVAHTLWVGKALPRVWLAEGQRVAVTSATTAYGRLSFVYTSHLTSRRTVIISVTWPSDSGRVPSGGLRVRVRVPTLGVGRPRAIKAVEVAGRPWRAVNVAQETVDFTAEELKAGLLLTSISVLY